VAENGKQGLQFLNSENFDIVIISDSMKGISGVDILKEIKRNDYCENVIFILESKSINVAGKLYAGGASDIITKPVTFESINNSCKRVIKRNILTLNYDRNDSTLNDVEKFSSNLSHIVIRLRNDNSVDYASSSWHSHTSIRVEEILGEYFNELIIDKLKQSTFENEMEALKNGSLHKSFLRVKLLCKGQEKDAYLIFHKFDSKAVIGTILMDQELVSERRTLELLASHDHKTGLLNSYSFKVISDELFNNAKNSEHLVIFIYIEGLKEYLISNGLVFVEELMMKIGVIINKNNKNTENSYRIFGGLFAQILPFNSLDTGIIEYNMLIENIKDYCSSNYERLSVKSCIISTKKIHLIN
jgi:DNA-binding NarL/FixJ family response regulator/GGDEF domain-containing protein